MFIKKTYLIRTHKENSIIKTDDKISEFQFIDKNDRTTIYFESQIGNFFEYENQLKLQLKKLNFTAKPWVTNKFYFSIPNNIHEIQKRCFFDSADKIGATQTYLLHENIAIQLTSQFKHTQKENTLFLGVYKTKIEFSVIKDLEIKFVKTLYADKEIMNELHNINNIIEQNLNILKNKFKINNFLLSYNNITNKSNLNFKDLFLFQQINNENKLILEGLETAAKNKLDYLYYRPKIN